jgi:hypothetical protein
MTVRLELEPALEAELSAEALARGLDVEHYVRNLVITSLPRSRRSETTAEAVAAIRKLSEGLTLKGLSIKQLIHEGRKY